MSTFVIVSLVVAVVSLGAVGVVGLALWRAVGDLRAAGATATERIRPLTAELAAEQAVTALELDALRRAAERRSAAPRRRT